MSRFTFNAFGRQERADDIRVNSNGDYEIIKPYSHERVVIPKESMDNSSIRREDKTILPGGNIFAPKFGDGWADK